MYREATGCPFPIYADPTRKLYDLLGMTRTLTMGTRPEYQRMSMIQGMMSSIVQGLKQIRAGKVLKGGDYWQVGGEFLFEPTAPMDMASPSPGFANADHKQLGEGLAERAEEKKVTWCHRMKNTRDHAEIPELREVLGFDGEGIGGKNEKRWTRAILERKGTGLSLTNGGIPASRKVSL